MLSIIGFLIFAAILIRFFPKTPSGAFLHGLFVELPAKLIERTERKHIIFLVFGLLMIQGFATVVTLDLAIIAALDASLYIDVMITAGVTGAVTRAKSTWIYVKSKMLNSIPRQIRPSVRAFKTKPHRPPISPPSSNDDERGGSFLLAA